MSITPSGTIAASGVRAATAVVRNRAHNTANLTTPGFQPGRTTLIEDAPGVRAQTQWGAQVDNPEPGDTSGVDLAQETVQGITARTLYTASLAVIRSEDERLGTLLDTEA